MFANRRIARVVASLAVLISTGAVLANANETLIGSGKIGKDSRKLGPFHAVTLLIPAEIIASQGAAEPVVLEGDDNILPKIKTEVKDGVLIIDSATNLIAKSKLSFKIKTPKLDQLTLKGTSSATVTDLNGPSFNFVSKGTSSATLSGTTAKLTAEMDGTGTLQALKLNAKDATVSIKGTGTAKVNASATLNATIKGTGTIKYAGDPKVTQSILGVGTISKN